MGNETKWADVAHYYAKSQIDLQIKNRDHAERFLMVSFRNVGGSHFEEWVNDGVYWRAYGSQFSAWADHKPILRHRDDMTEAEAREICEPMIESLKEVEGDSFEPPKSYKEFLHRPFTHKGTWSLLDHVLGNPRDWHKLIKWGIDVFRLIESGQAIRKEVGNA